MRLPPGLSLTARLALLFAVLTASLLIMVGVVIGRAVEHHFQELDDHELVGKLTLVANLLQGADPMLPLAERLSRLDDAFAGHDMVAVLLRDTDGRVLHAVQPGFFTPAQLAGTEMPIGSTEWTQDDLQVIGRAARIELPAGTGAPSEALTALVALDISHHIHFLAELRRGLWLAISVAAIAAALLGWFAAHRGLAPLRRVTATARHLSAERLGERLAEDDAPPEVHELVEAFNGMLARLEKSFRRLSDFSADIAHELRTPVSNLMTQTQVALSRARSADEYREVLASNMEEFERIARMVADMLFLAQAEDGRLPRTSESVALADEAVALIEFYDALAEAQGVRITVEGAASVRGDRLMLRRALSNLLSNALRHTPVGGCIRICLRNEGDEVEVQIENDGEPIASAQLERIFDRFHRASADRRRHGEGAGLGLAITRSIVQAHGGRIWASSTAAPSPPHAGTTTFTVRLPVDADASPQAATPHGSTQESAT